MTRADEVRASQGFESEARGSRRNKQPSPVPARRLCSTEGQFCLSQVLLTPGSTLANFYSGQFYSGQVPLGPGSTWAKFFLGQLHLGQVRLRPMFFPCVCVVCVLCWCVVWVCCVSVLCCVCCACVSAGPLRSIIIKGDRMNQTCPKNTIPLDSKFQRPCQGNTIPNHSTQCIHDNLKPPSLSPHRNLYPLHMVMLREVRERGLFEIRGTPRHFSGPVQPDKQVLELHCLE